MEGLARSSLRESEFGPDPLRSTMEEHWGFYTRVVASSQNGTRNCSHKAARGGLLHFLISISNKIKYI